MTVDVGHGWRTRLREAIALLVTFGAGVVAATAGAGIGPRAVGAVLFVAGAYALLDAIVLASSWRLTSGGLKIPTLAQRHREIAGGSDLVVTPHGRWMGSIVIDGPRGRRVLNVNPLVSPSDLRRWFAAIADGESS